jgi:hypothetical protein
VYILPALPMLAVASAPLIAGIVRRAAFQRLAFGLALILAALFAGAGVAAWWGEPAFERRLIEERGLEEAGTALWWMLIAIGVIGLGAAAGLRPRRGFAALAITQAAIWVLALGFWGYPLLNDSSSARALMARARELAGAERTIGLVAWKEQNYLMLRGPVADFGFRRPFGEQRAAGLAWLAEDPGRRRLFVQADALGPCLEPKRVLRVGSANRREWFLVGDDARRADCVDRGDDPRDQQRSAGDSDDD